MIKDYWWVINFWDPSLRSGWQKNGGAKGKKSEIRSQRSEIRKNGGASRRPTTIYDLLMGEEYKWLMMNDLTNDNWWFLEIAALRSEWQGRFSGFLPQACRDWGLFLMFLGGSIKSFKGGNILQVYCWRMTKIRLFIYTGGDWRGFFRAGKGPDVKSIVL